MREVLPVALHCWQLLPNPALTTIAAVGCTTDELIKGQGVVFEILGDEVHAIMRRDMYRNLLRPTTAHHVLGCPEVETGPERQAAQHRGFACAHNLALEVLSRASLHNTHALALSCRHMRSGVGERGSTGLDLSLPPRRPRGRCGHAALPVPLARIPHTRHATTRATSLQHRHRR